jgi:branched-chain amino acid transport system ATP-binding protein
MLAIGRALMARPKIMMMDEPSLGLAPIIVEEIFDIISLLNKEGVSILLVEQNARMALKVAHRVYLLEGGKVTFNGNPQEMQQDEVIQRAYLGAGST